MKKRAERRQLAECSSYDAAWITQHLIVAQKNERERKRREKRTSEARAVGRAREGTEGYERRWNGDDGEGRTGEGVGGGGNGDVLAKVTAGNAVYVRRSKVACRVAELFSFSRSIFPSALSLPLPSCSLRCRHPLLLVRPFVSISLFLSLLSDPAARRRLQECTKCTALTDARPHSTASTYLLRPFASLRSSLFFSLSLSFRGPSFLFSLVGYSASAGHSRILYIVLPPPPPPPSSLPLPGTVRFSTTVWWCVSSLHALDRTIVRTTEHASTHAYYVRTRYAEEARCRCSGYIPGRTSRRVLTAFVLAPSRRAFSFSLLFEVFFVSFDRASFYVPVLDDPHLGTRIPYCRLSIW